MKKILTLVVFSLSLGGSAANLVSPTSVTAQYQADSSLCSGSNISLKPASDTYNPCLDKNGDGKVDAADNAVASSEGRIEGVIAQVINILSAIVGILAVIFIILGGAKYITSSGDSAKIGSAKNTVVYAIVGLIIVALAQVIVRFVLNKV